MKVLEIETVRQYRVFLTEEEMRVIGVAIECASYLNERYSVVSEEILTTIQNTLGEDY